MDLRLKCGRTLQIVGPSGCGKTLFTVNLLQNRKHCFNVPLNRVYWFYGSEEGEIGETAKAIKSLKDVKMIHGFVDGWNKLAKRHDCIVIDDLFIESGKEKDLENLFIRTARHREIFVIFLTQNLFYKGMRTKNINTHYLVLFKNPRDTLVIQTLSTQMAIPDRKAMFHDATYNKPFGYLFFDFTQETPDELRIRTDIFKSPMIIYKQQ
mgnify:CR=1 FL=1